MRQHILVVDADAASLRSLQLSLKSIGHTVDTAETGWDGLTKLEQANYDVVLLDYMMPRFTGSTVLQHIQARHPSLPVVMMTGYTGHHVAAAQLLTAGARACLVKPVDPVDLERALQACVGTTSSGRSYLGRPMTPSFMRFRRRQMNSALADRP